jgi:Zn-finger nucleic acid-binding protein
LVGIAQKVLVGDKAAVEAAERMTGMSGLNERSKRQIALLASDDLDAIQAEEARRSIDSCPHCRGHWTRVRGCLDLLERAGKESASVPDFSVWPAVESRLAPSSVRKPERFNGWVPALSMAAACIALLIAGQLESAPQDFLDGESVPAPRVSVNPAFLPEPGFDGQVTPLRGDEPSPFGPTFDDAGVYGPFSLSGGVPFEPRWRIGHTGE